MRTKYLATFQQTDRGRTGFIAGVQARNILLQSGLPQNILAQIWSLSDYDNDGRLSSEEFILAGHLCEMAQKGEPLPSQLPANLIPPTLRKGGAQPGTPVAGPATGMVTPTTFEDKRKENFDKGQEVLEKRRQSLIEEQKKLEEERKRKEKEEAEAKEKQKREAERRRQAEIERQLQKQREAEEQRRLAEEKKRAARQEIGRDTSELQSHHDLVCRLLLEKKKQQPTVTQQHHKKSEDRNNPQIHSINTNQHITEKHQNTTYIKS